MASAKQRIVFFHPDLGIGGAERLVIDAAVGLQKLGYAVTIYTSHCDAKHCFDEARDGTLDVRVRGNGLIPQTIFGRFWILCAILRQLHMLLQIALLSNELGNLKPSIFFVDQLSAGVPLLRAFVSRTKIIFYCHFPDKYLAQRDGLLKSLYRLPFDWWESWSTGCSDKILVNSKFTKSVFAQAFPALRNRDAAVVYPCVDTEVTPKRDQFTIKGPLWNEDRIFLSINRFERKKDIGLAIEAYAKIPAASRAGSKLVIAGGYDNRVKENVSYLKELESLVETLGLKYITARTIVSASAAAPDDQIIFFLSVPNAIKEKILSSAKLLIYTPRNEHLGIVPLEAMRDGVPVLAANEGGPTETVVDGVTGWLRSVDKMGDWTEIMEEILSQNITDETLQKMGRSGRDHVRQLFSRARMAQILDEEIKKTMKDDARRRYPVLGQDAAAVGLVVILLLGLASAVGLRRFV